MLLGPDKISCYIRYFVISDLSTSSFHCNGLSKVFWILFSLFIVNFATEMMQSQFNSLFATFANLHVRKRATFADLHSYNTPIVHSYCSVKRLPLFLVSIVRMRY